MNHDTVMFAITAAEGILGLFGVASAFAYRTSRNRWRKNAEGALDVADRAEKHGTDWHNAYNKLNFEHRQMVNRLSMGRLTKDEASAYARMLRHKQIAKAKAAAGAKQSA